MLLRLQTQQADVAMDKPDSGGLDATRVPKRTVHPLPTVQLRDNARGEDDETGQARQATSSRHLDDARLQQEGEVEPDGSRPSGVPSARSTQAVGTHRAGNESHLRHPTSIGPWNVHTTPAKRSLVGTSIGDSGITVQPSQWGKRRKSDPIKRPNKTLRGPKRGRPEATSQPEQDLGPTRTKRQKAMDASNVAQVARRHREKQWSALEKEVINSVILLDTAYSAIGPGVVYNNTWQPHDTAYPPGGSPLGLCAGPTARGGGLPSTHHLQRQGPGAGRGGAGVVDRECSMIRGK